MLRSTTAVVTATCLLRHSHRVLPECGCLAVAPVTSMVVSLPHRLLGYVWPHVRAVDSRKKTPTLSRQESFLWQFMSEQFWILITSRCIHVRSVYFACARRIVCRLHCQVITKHGILSSVTKSCFPTGSRKRTVRTATSSRDGRPRAVWFLAGARGLPVS
jgi:hypothetical protein